MPAKLLVELRLLLPKWPMPIRLTPEINTDFHGGKLPKLAEADDLSGSVPHSDALAGIDAFDILDGSSRQLGGLQCYSASTSPRPLPEHRTG